MQSQFSEEDIAEFIRNVPQIVPESWCLNCKICCRFPDTENVQTPAWSPLEAGWARSHGGNAGWFTAKAPSPSLSPVLEPCGHGYLCPAFDGKTSRCTIYPVRPLDCRIYPFVLARDAGQTRVVLSMDMKCPYLEKHGTDPEVLTYASELTRYLQRPEAMAYLKMNPEIVGPMWPEFVHVAAMPEMAVEIQAPLKPLHPALRPVAADGAVLLQKALAIKNHEHSSYTLAGLLGWSDLIRYGWCSINGAFCLFAEQAGGLFMPLPPLVERLERRPIERAWEILTEANGGGSVSRIEGVESADLPLYRAIGFEAAPAEPEYLYSRRNLVELQGDRYRSQRWSVNRASKEMDSYLFRPFEERDLLACLQLYTAWGIKRQMAAGDFFPKALIRDGLFFHRRLMVNRAEYGLVGRVLEVNGKIRGYTFGAPISSSVFCVFLEIADRGIPGSAQVLFHRFCAEMDSFEMINAMGDCGLAGLRRSKTAYRPERLTGTYTVSRPSA